MSDKVLSDGEMDALMQGVSSGRVEVQTGAGVVQANVASFEIHPKAHLKTGSLPELQRINETLAEHLQRFFRNSLHWEVSCDLKSQSRRRIGDIRETYSGLRLSSVFMLPPLTGPGLLLIDSSTLSALVDKYFGSPKIAQRATPAERFSAGEMRIAERFTNEVLSGLKTAWEALLEIDPQPVQVEQSLSRIRLGSDKEPAVLSEFQIDAGELTGEFALVLPFGTLADVQSSLEGADLPGSPEQNAEWAAALRAHVTETRITLAGHTRELRLNLGAVTALAPGDVLPITSPESVLLSAAGVSLLHGEFGTHKDERCVRVRGWTAERNKHLSRRQSHG